MVKGITDRAEGRRCNSRADQVGHDVANATTFPRSCVAQALSCGDGPAIRCTLLRNTASVMMI